MKNKPLLLLIISLLIQTFFIQPIPPRMRNFGATCFLNGTTQALYGIQPLTNFLLFQKRMNVYEPNSLASLYTNLITAFNTRRSQEERKYGGALRNFADKAYELIEGCTPGLGCSFRKGCRQEDATEFLKSILTSLIDDDTRYRNIPENRKFTEHPIAKLLAIHFTETIICPSIRFTAHKTITPELYLFPAIQVTGGRKLTSLTECLSHYFQTELLNEPDNYYKLDLSTAQLQQRPDLAPYNETAIPNCKKTTKITHLGDIVIIALKRFAFLDENYRDAVTRYPQEIEDYFTIIDETPEAADFLDFPIEPNIEDFFVKLDFSVDIPQQMNFTPYFASSAKKPEYYYELISAVHHAGVVGGGHYIAFVKDAKTNQWYTCDDSTITAVTFDAIKDDINKSYIVIYQKNEKAKITQQAPVKRKSDQALINALQQLEIKLKQLERTLKV